MGSYISFNFMLSLRVKEGDLSKLFWQFVQFVLILAISVIATMSLQSAQHSAQPSVKPKKPSASVGPLDEGNK